MATLIGLGLAVAVAMFGRIAGFDRDRAFYPTVLVVVASYYVLFASVSEKHDQLALQLVIFGLFATLAVLGFRISLWFAVAGLAGHGLFDFAYQFIDAGGGVPKSWPAFCLAFDVAAAVALAALLVINGRNPSVVESGHSHHP